jgi:hypothetical protein
MAEVLPAPRYAYRRIFSGIGAVVGLSIVVFFSTLFVNYATVVMGGISGIFAAIVYAGVCCLDLVLS